MKRGLSLFLSLILLLLVGVFFLWNSYALLCIVYAGFIMLFLHALMGNSLVMLEMIISYIIVLITFYSFTFSTAINNILNKIFVSDSEFVNSILARTTEVIASNRFRPIYFYQGVLIIILVATVIVSIDEYTETIHKALLIITSVGLGFASIFMFDNKIRVRNYDLISDKVTSSIRIVHLSDTHDEDYYFRSSNNLEKMVKKQNPDLIFLTGDIFDEGLKFENTLKMLDKIDGVAPIYYVTGNHEINTKKYEDKIAQMVDKGVIYLSDGYKVTKVNGNNVVIAGLEDPLKEGKSDGERIDKIQKAIPKENENDLKLLLSHRAERVKGYRESEFDGVYSGHIHGGQARIPFLINGLYSPFGEFFPKYAGGEYELSEKTVMFVSRGLKITGPARIFNPPEIVVTNIIPE